MVLYVDTFMHNTKKASSYAHTTNQKQFNHTSNCTVVGTEHVYQTQTSCCNFCHADIWDWILSEQVRLDLTFCVCVFRVFSCLSAVVAFKLATVVV